MLRTSAIIYISWAYYFFLFQSNLVLILAVFARPPWSSPALSPKRVWLCCLVFARMNWDQRRGPATHVTLKLSARNTRTARSPRARPRRAVSKAGSGTCPRNGPTYPRTLGRPSQGSYVSLFNKLYYLGHLMLIRIFLCTNFQHSTIHNIFKHNLHLYNRKVH